MIQVKVFGERNTGTNFVQRLLSSQQDIQLVMGAPNKWIAPIRNIVKARVLGVASDQHLLKERVQRKNQVSQSVLRHRSIPQDIVWSAYFGWTQHRNFGWKHRNLDEHTLKQSKKFRETKFLCLVRNPYQWLISMRRRPYGLGVPPGADWAQFLSFSWNSKSYDAKPQVHYNTPVDEDPTKPGDSQSLASYRQSYLDQEWVNNIPREFCSQINNDLDRELCQQLNYRFIEQDA